MATNKTNAKSTTDAPVTNELQALIAQQEALAAQIAELRAEKTAEAIESCLKKIALYGITQEQLFPHVRGKRGPKPGSTRAPGEKATVAPKYRDRETGATWSGRGKPPHWIKDAEDREAYAI